MYIEREEEREAVRKCEDYSLQGTVELLNCMCHKNTSCDKVNLTTRIFKAIHRNG